MANVATVNAQDSLVEKARKLYMDEKYDLAIDAYEALVKEYSQNYEFYYNLGNAYYKYNNFVYAILNYERALRLNPNDEDLLYNLQMAKATQVDKIDEIPEYPYMKFFNGFLSILSSNGWAYIAIVLFLGFLFFVYLFFFTQSAEVKKRSFFFGILILCTSLVFSFFSYSAKKNDVTHNTAIVITPSVTLKGAPSSGGKDLLVIHEGLKVTILDELEGWVNVRLGNGESGWTKKTDIVGI